MLVETKLYAPPARKEWVPRTELIRGLAGGMAKLVLVGAPAGFGKSTLVAQWDTSPAETRPFAWISLDAGDDDPGRLWWHLACAVQRACPDFRGEQVLQALRAQVPDFAGVVLPLLVNQLAALPDPVVLVLDDYHVIEAPSCHDQVASRTGRTRWPAAATWASSSGCGTRPGHREFPAAAARPAGLAGRVLAFGNGACGPALIIIRPG